MIKDTQVKKHKFIFQAFLQACPRISVKVDQVKYPDQSTEQFADVKTVMRDSSVVEWQLGSWLDQNQMRAAKQRESLDAELRRVFSTIPNTTANFRQCLILPDSNSRRFQKTDTEGFRTELQHLIKKVDLDWSNAPHLQSPQGQLCRDFETYPALLKYVQSILFMPLEETVQFWSTGSTQSWIEVEGWGGAYNPLTAVEALRNIITKKAKRYGPLKGTDARLLLHYDEAILYNSPYDNSNTTFEDMAQVAGCWLLDFPELHTRFTEVYLLYTAEQLAFQVFPVIYD